jgi:hypothetical protein
MNNRISVNRPEQVSTPPMQYAVAGTADMKLYAPQYMSGSYTEALDHYNNIVRKDPALAEQLQVISAYELSHN